VKGTIGMVQESPLANRQDPDHQFDQRAGIIEACSLLDACRHLCKKVYPCVEHALAATLVCMEDWDRNDWSPPAMPWIGRQGPRFHPLEAYAVFMGMDSKELEGQAVELMS